ncbi:MAG: LPS-assembly lipoprotein LptE [Catillopecten margaritatus gill symbiont]|uniref:LPS-assembly lipoprotein LptE n=1 Tax=Catillopecten margaritatus gill symbiont TaxID=3083288 RepID=A0AAU6PGD3_9GAMM
MSKINLLSILLISSLLSACGFHTPNNAISLNASITGKSDSAFATELTKHFNAKAKQSLIIQIGEEVQKQQATAYSGNVASSYTLMLSVPIKISRDKKNLLSTTLTASTTISEISTSQADRLKINANYAQLRKRLVTNLLRRLKALK